MMKHLNIIFLLGLLLVLLPSCSTEKTAAEVEADQTRSVTPEIGVFYQGGYVFYLFQPGDDRYVEGEIHGLIAAPENLADEGMPWAPEGFSPYDPILSQQSDNGYENSKAIVTIYGEGHYAAKACLDLELGDFDDWYQGSDKEMSLMCENLVHGEFDNDFELSELDHFWSSNELGILAKKPSRKLTASNDYGIGGSTMYFDLCLAEEGFDKDYTQIKVRAIRDF
ncbi:hypothetical protein [Robertkochia aurantiaca]|uniref:hypothetical protein n=1 Tax=Robertkochia aurantiaca TaxID=2873700 RepID=UPI001CCF8AC1|nr:hypothetical protein [Robertkochia sp. 3YJGBD-33]